MVFFKGKGSILFLFFFFRSTYWWGLLVVGVIGGIVKYHKLFYSKQFHHLILL